MSKALQLFVTIEKSCYKVLRVRGLTQVVIPGLMMLWSQIVPRIMRTDYALLFAVLLIVVMLLATLVRIYISTQNDKESTWQQKIRNFVQEKLGAQETRRPKQS